MVSNQSYLQPMNAIFGAVRINFDDIHQLQKSTPNLLIYAMPAIILFTILEYSLAKLSRHKSYEHKESIASLFIGMGNLVVNLFMKAVLFYAAVWMYNLLPWRMQLNWWTLIPCFIIYDCCSYWSHRISHFNRFFWATHVVHHSAEHYNLTVAFRQSWVQHFKTIFFIPVALIGFHPVIFFLTSQLSVLYQFWVHTEAIGKLHPFIEKFFGTPSNHRVHHGSQEKYLDKNFGATFMIWDHLFGTFQYEEEKPVYGLTTPVENKTNPFVLNFHEYREMLDDIKQSDGLKELLFFIFASPGKIYKHKSNRALQLSKVPIRTSKRLLRSILIIITMILLLSQITYAQNVDQSKLPKPNGCNLLFFLQRDPDANTVVYELNYNTDGTLQQSNPIKGSWIRYNEGQQFKELSPIEKKFAYGVKSKPIGEDEYEIRLVAYKKMPMYLKKSETDHKYHIYIKDEGKDLLLKRIFVRVNGGSFWFPKVEYIDLITTNSITGMEILKRIRT